MKKITISKFLYGMVGVLIAVYVCWFIASHIFRRKPEYFTPGGAQEQLASKNTEVAPVSDEPKSKEALKYLSDKDKLPPLVLDTGRVERPYLVDPINSLDDYEYNLVFQNEGSRELSTETKNALTSAYPMDWAAMPPSAAVFQAGKSEMFNAPPTAQIPTDTYKAIEDASLMPPDMDALEDEEQKILATYAPKHAGDLTTYDVEDAKELIHKIYNARDQVPEISEQGNNVFQILGVQPKHPKFTYEDEPAPSVGGQMYSNPKAFDVIAVPQAPADTSAALDPFYEARNSVRNTRTDYTKWTPGLERMFAPTYEHRDWS